MMRLIPLLGLFVLCAAGCTTSYHVYINGYSELPASLAKDVPICVATDSGSRNPVRDDQVKVKIDRLLRDDGYTVVPPDQAEYRLSFQLGTRSEEIIGYAPYREYYRGGYGWHRGGYGFGYTAAVPYVDTLSNHWLTMRLSRVKPNEPNEGKVVWVGEAMTQMERPDTRQAIDYLLVACLERLGLDTHGQVMISIRQDDPRIQDAETNP